MARVSYKTVNEHSTPREMVECLRGAMEGSLNIGGTATLNGTETIINDTRIGGQSVLQFQAINAAGAAIVPTIWVKSRGKFTATLDHAAATTLQVEYVVLG
jgi:hypothetical protein